MARPLTHHEILRLAAPFSRAGWQVDLAATDRERRRTAFHAAAHPLTAAGDPAGDGVAEAGLAEARTLVCPESGDLELICTFTEPDGASAVLRSAGPDPAALLALREAWQPQALFAVIGGCRVAFSYRAGAAPPGAAAVPWHATGAEARVAGRRVRLDASRGAGLPARIEITPHADGEPALPEDLLGVLGWAWRPLLWRGGAWQSTVAVRRHEPQRRPDVEAKALRLVAHLSAVLAAPPRAYHERFRRQRWAAAGRRVLPMAAFLLILAAVPIFGVLLPEGEMPPWLHGVPPLLAVGALLFSGYEVPLVDRPPLPRPLTVTSWQGGGDER